MIFFFVSGLFPMFFFVWKFPSDNSAGNELFSRDTDNKIGEWEYQQFRILFRAKKTERCIACQSLIHCQLSLYIFFGVVRAISVSFSFLENHIGKNSMEPWKILLLNASESVEMHCNQISQQEPVNNNNNNNINHIKWSFDNE